VSELPRLVVVTGPPGSGKTTIAAALRERLGLPLIAKDAIKEALGDALEFDGDRHASRRLGVATFGVQFAIVRELLASGVSLIAEGNFRSDEWFRSLPPARVAQVHVTAAPDAVRQRLLARDRHRHRVHYDREAADEVAESVRAGEWNALPLPGTVIALDTTDAWPDAAAVAARVRQVLDGS
jgi:predicted kinase